MSSSKVSFTFSRLPISLKIPENPFRTTLLKKPTEESNGLLPKNLAVNEEKKKAYQEIFNSLSVELGLSACKLVRRQCETDIKLLNVVTRREHILEFGICNTFWNFLEHSKH
eukprot:Lithocolla_globosa_v1_NODE_3629_length_1620_cov_31.361661.p1 type:complete len:112 gc:universal NODE_3629_length_1620_cov_31.361661:1105-770(-)